VIFRGAASTFSLIIVQLTGKDCHDSGQQKKFCCPKLTAYLNPVMAIQNQQTGCLNQQMAISIQATAQLKQQTALLNQMMANINKMVLKGKIIPKPD
jgi:hypothetical protein